MGGSRQPRTAIASGVAVVLLLMGCSGGGTDGASDDDQSEGRSNEESLGSDDRPPTPLEGFLTDVLGDESDGGMGAAQERAAQEHIAACMGEQGFDYVPYVPDSEDLFPVAGGGPAPWDLPPDEFAATYGYGLFTTIGLYDEVALDDVAARNPNVAIVAEMSDSERAAYEEALHGPGGTSTDVAADPSAASEAIPIEDAERGCLNQAWDLVNAANDPTQALDQEVWVNAVSAYENLQTQIAEDPRLVEAEQEWAHCMADAGHPGLEGIDDVKHTLQAKFQAAQGASPSPESPGGIEPQALEELKQEEIDLATADYDCQQESGYDQTEYEVREELESEFLEDHQQEIDAIREALALSDD